MVATYHFKLKAEIEQIITYLETDYLPENLVNERFDNFQRKAAAFKVVENKPFLKKNIQTILSTIHLPGHRGKLNYTYFRNESNVASLHSRLLWN